MSREASDLREFERLKKLYPLFKFEWANGKTVNNVTVTFSKSSSYCFAIEHGRFSRDNEMLPDKEHSERSMNKALVSLYPDLYISTHINRHGILLGIWVNRNDSDAEAIGNLEITLPNLHTTLQGWQEEAKKAKQDGHFFCSGHVRAEPKPEYGYFHFAGTYCKQWGDEHPKSRQEAARETYN